MIAFDAGNSPSIPYLFVSEPELLDAARWRIAYNPFPGEEIMAIKVGDTIPSIDLMTMTADGPSCISTDDIFSGKKIAFFGLPGAFTPTCSAKHLPGFVQNADALKAKDIDTIVCLAVNDAFVMGAWGQDQNVDDRVMMVADGSAAFTKATGLGLDLTERGLGIRSRRYSMVVDDGVVSHFNLEEALKFVEMVKPERTYFTHISHMLGFHAEVEEELPENVHLAYDNLKIEI